MRSSELPPDREALADRLKKIGLHGIAASLGGMADLAPVVDLVGLEETDRRKRSYERRLRHARIGAFKSMADYDWRWPSRVDRVALDELFTLGFVEEGTNVILAGPNGLGKTMILRNLAHHALTQGLSVRCVSASEMLADLASQDSSSALRRRLRRYCVPKLLCIDEVGYLSYDSRYADLLFEVVTHRYEAQRPIVLTTNKGFADWADVFPHAACVVTLVDRLTHRAEVITLEGKSYRLKESEELAEGRKKRRRSAHKEHA
jgi:DNA replication protein DnaC